MLDFIAEAPHWRPRKRQPAVSQSLSDTAASDRLECSVGVMAYNEEANIANAIESILGQKLTASRVAELIVVASGCSDRTADIVAGIARQDPRVRLLEQERREGKASAINLFISAARAPVLLLVSADLLVEAGTVDALVRHFHDPTVGMVGGHPTPVNNEGTFLGHAVHLQWRLHDLIARQDPKLGEIVAFRNVVPSIPPESAVDEISIQALITQLGFRLVYEPEAVVYNRGPSTVSDFLRQRRRIYAGHLRVREQQGYCASTMSTRIVARSLLASRSFITPRTAMFSVGAVGLEAVARALGHYDVARGRAQHVWEISDTTKRHIADGVHAHEPQTVAVFQISDFHRHKLEFGVHASRRLTRRVAGRIERAFDETATVSVSAQENGTIVALVPGDREAAEKTAQDLVQRFQATPMSLNGRGLSPRVTLACGLIAFGREARPLASSIPMPAMAGEAAAAVA